MFLTTLLADAAAQHGHEFSNPRPTTPARLSPIPRVMRPQSALARTRPSLVTNDNGKPPGMGEVTRIEKVMFKEEAEIKLVENLRRSLEESSEEESQRPSMDTAAATAATGGLAEALPVRKRAKKEARSKTAYTFAHTAARVNALHKLKSRPPAVLQLQKVTPGARPKPAFEVFPSGRYAKKLGRDLARLHKGKDKLGAEDVVLCKAHEYDAHEDDWESQEVVGIVCASCKDESHASGNAQLCLEDGSTWEAIPYARGRYDFVSIDEHGINRTVRWVPRRIRSKPKPSSNPTSPIGSPTPVEETVYRFSTIDSRTRRHPVIATMTPTELEISDSYYLPRSMTQDASETAPDATPDKEDAPESDGILSERELIHTAPLLRSLILLSGIYVALRNNWSPVFSYKKESNRATDLNKIGNVNNAARSPNASPTPSAERVPFGTQRRHTFNFHRRSSTVGTISATSMSTALSGGYSEHSITDHSLPSRSTTPDSRRRRTESLLTGLMRSATDRPADKGRQMSAATESSESTTAEGSEYSMNNGTRTPTPSGRRGTADTSIEEFAAVRSPTSMSGGFLQRASSLRKHWRMSSNPMNEPEFIGLDTSTNTVADVPDVSTPTSAQPSEDGAALAVDRRRFSFSRGRARQRFDQTSSLSGSSARPPAAYHNHQWWMNWGAEQAASRPSSVIVNEPEPSSPVALTEDYAGVFKTRLPSEPTQRTHRRSFSIQTWRKKDPVERPKSVFVTSPGDLKSMMPGGEDNAIQPVTSADMQKRDNGRFGGLMRRVTHRLRREERKIG